MKITFATSGSRGDVQPYIALAQRLQQAGHQATVAAPDNFRTLIAEAGVTFAHAQGIDPQEFIRRPDLQAAARSGGQLRIFVAMLRAAGPLITQILEGLWEACAGADLVVGGTIPYGVFDYAEAHGVPAVYAPLHMIAPTRAFPNPFFAPFGIHPHAAYNAVTHLAVRAILQRLMGSYVTRWRATHGLPPITPSDYLAMLDARRTPTVYGFSTAVLPTPSDLPAWHSIAGYWQLAHPTWTPPPDLARFLDAGPPPLSIGFGSMDDREPERITRVVLEALALTGQRAILLSGWGGLGHTQLPSNVFRLSAAPHDWLFPRMSAVVHHGGAGTTAASLRAGVPTVIVPFAADQPFWATRVAQLGVGVQAPSFFSLTAPALAAALTRATENQALRARAAALGARLRAEDGPGKAMQVILGSARRKPAR